jgi:poly-gamma-glutamate synthesis protein (capsule biosynthesis protein)
MITITTTADPAEQEFAEEQVRRLRKQVDFLCLSLHWGYGGLSSRIATYQRPLAHSMIEAGADVIFGNHVHAVQGVEKYQGKLIFYSPGTFIGRQLPPESEGGEITDLVRSLLADMSPDGYLALIDIDSDGDYIGRMVPTSLDARGLPVVAAGADFDRIASRIVDWSSQLGTAVTRSNGGLAVG